MKKKYFFAKMGKFATYYDVTLSEDLLMKKVIFV